MVALPELGDLVAHGNELWIVASVGDDEAGTLVVCDPPAGAVSERTMS